MRSNCTRLHTSDVSLIVTLCGRLNELGRNSLLNGSRRSSVSEIHFAVELAKTFIEPRSTFVSNDPPQSTINRDAKDCISVLGIDQGLHVSF